MQALLGRVQYAALSGAVACTLVLAASLCGDALVSAFHEIACDLTPSCAAPDSHRVEAGRMVVSAPEREAGE